MMRTASAFGVAIGIAICLSAGMFAFANFMAQKASLWADQGLELSTAQILALQASAVFINYWWAIIPVVFVVCLALGAACGSGRRHES